jgi:hypothetical protein
MTTPRKTKGDELHEDAQRAGLVLCTYSPGDGVTRYRFFRPCPDTCPVCHGARPSYFGGHNTAGTVLGYAAARTFVNGALAGAYPARPAPHGAGPHARPRPSRRPRACGRIWS